MSKYITTTLSITSNAYTATSNPGPTTSPLAISVSDLLDVTAVESKIIDVTTTHQLLWDASDYFVTEANTGVDGAYIYFRNLLEENATADLLHDLVIHNTDATALAADHAPRMFTLQPGEFAWMPWDLTQDLYCDAAETNAGALETILFVRTSTVRT
tara:strand:+ start:812 stop:1282 length:471 start_codon:yes stop_codon:yes gene_type:complete